MLGVGSAVDYRGGKLEIRKGMAINGDGKE
jgi:hypothetical protein